MQFIVLSSGYGTMPWKHTPLEPCYAKSNLSIFGKQKMVSRVFTPVTHLFSAIHRGYTPISPHL